MTIELNEKALDAAVCAFATRDVGWYKEMGLRVSEPQLSIEEIKEMYGKRGYEEWLDDAKTAVHAYLLSLEQQKLSTEKKNG